MKFGILFLSILLFAILMWLNIKELKKINDLYDYNYNYKFKIN